MLALTAALHAQGLPAVAEDVALPEVTDQVFLDVGICMDGYRKDRRLGDASILCDNPEALGRIVIDLYGEAGPRYGIQLQRAGSVGGAGR